MTRKELLELVEKVPDGENIYLYNDEYDNCFPPTSLNLVKVSTRDVRGIEILKRSICKGDKTKEVWILD